MKKGLYTRPLTITSQFSFCGLPLRLDSYAGCGFRCSYCFARYRSANKWGDAIRPADPNTLQRRFDRIAFPERTRPGIIGQFLQRRVPIHFGGMSDPFQTAETRYRITEAFLRTLARYNYPTVISTRGTLIADEPYVSILREIGNVVVQFSFSSTRDEISTLVEPFSTPPSQLLKVMERLKNQGINITCRWQPFIPGFSEPPAEFLSRIADTGCSHVALEHLKLPVERQNPLWTSLNVGVGRNLYDEYKRLGARKEGWEYVLPVSYKLPNVLEVSSLVRKLNMTFGAADNEIQYLSDTECCCSGVDQFPGFENWFKYQIGYAVRKCKGKEIKYDAISSEWCPNGSIDRFLNGYSRISSRTGLKGTLKEHIEARWNNVLLVSNPASFWGIKATNQTTASGKIIYDWIEPDKESDQF